MRVLCLVLVSFALLVPLAKEAGANRLRAALSLYFVEHGAFPVGALNPAHIGDLLRMTRAGAARVQGPGACYPGLKVQGFRRIESAKERYSFDASAEFSVSAEVLHESIAEAAADMGVSIAISDWLWIDPLSSQDPKEIQALWAVDLNNPDCEPIAQVLNGQPNGQIVVSRVFHGTVGYEKRLEISASAGASAKLGELGKRVKSRLPVDEVAARVEGSYLSLSKARTPAPRSLAVVPLNLDPVALLAVSAYLDGERGAALEILVKEALRNKSLSISERWWETIRDWLGGEFDCENYAQKFFAAQNPMSLDQLRREYGEKIRMKNVAIYMAAHDLTCGE